jgi:hypothetical protein
MNTTDYLREGLRQLQDRKFYKLLDHDPSEHYASEFDQVLLEMRGNNLITAKNYEYLRPQNCKEGRFYMLVNLPKIHKKVHRATPSAAQWGILLTR